MKGLWLTFVTFLLASLSIVLAAPAADHQLVRTTTDIVTTTEEELDFKDVPIFEKDQPRHPAPAGTKYMSVLKCGGNSADDGQRSHDKNESPGIIHDPTIEKTTKDVPSAAKDIQDKGKVNEFENVPDAQSQPIAVAEAELSLPLVPADQVVLLSVEKEGSLAASLDSIVPEKVVELVPVADKPVDDVSLDQSADVKLPHSSTAVDEVEEVVNVETDSTVEDAQTEPVFNILVVSDEKGQFEVTVQNTVLGNGETAPVDEEKYEIQNSSVVPQNDLKKETNKEKGTGVIAVETSSTDTVVVDTSNPDSALVDLPTGQEETAVPVKSSPAEEEDQNEDGFENNGETNSIEEDSSLIKDYSGYKVYRVTIPTEEAARWILKFEDVPGIEFWADPKLLLRPRGMFVTSAADVLVAPDVTDFIEEALRQARLPYEILIKDVQDAIRNENPSEPLDVDELTSRNGHRLTWERYHSLDDIESYLEYLKVTFPDFVTVIEIGSSTEGRPIKAVKLHQKGGRAEKKSILIDAGIHAREWITPATITYIIREIVDNPQKYECIMNEFDWLFIPVLNPDGYNFTHTHNRMWRKTRSRTDSIIFRKAAAASLKADRLSRFEDDPILDDAILERLRSQVASKAGLSCTGADANRNFDYHWLTGGSSRNPCSETFAGPKPFSEPEARALRDLVLDNKDSLSMYVSLHAYSQMWLIPWGYKQEKPEDFSDLYSLAKTGANALSSVNGVDYLIGTIPELLYVASGSSIDWVKGAVGVKYAFTLELRDSGRYGFLLPASQILPSGKETWTALYASAVELATRVYSDSASCPTL